MRARIARGKNACKLKVDRHNKNSGFRQNLSYAVLLTIRIITIKDNIYAKPIDQRPRKLGLKNNTKMIFAMFICTETRKNRLKI